MASDTRFTGSIRVKEDIISRMYNDGKKPLIYARKGDTVTIISDHGNVIIAENEKGIRFPMEKCEGA